MVLSCVLCSIAVNWVALPNSFVVTGITGLSMAAAQFTGVNYALIYYGLALAILLCTALALGWREVSNILVLSLLYPVVLWGLNHIQVEIILQEKLIAVMLFGAIYGLGSGLTYRLGYSYGGTDTLAVARQFFCETRTEFLRKNSPVLRSKSETRSLASTAPKMEGAAHVKGRVLAWGGAAFAAPPLAFCPWGSSYPSVASPASWAATGSVYSDQP